MRCAVVIVGMVAVSWGVAGSAQAKEGKSYIALSLGMGLKASRPGTNVDTGVPFKEYWNRPVGVSAAYGYSIRKNIRAEAELFRGKLTLDSITGPNYHSTHNGGIGATAWALMANGYYDFETGTKIVPYVGAGVGVARVVRDSGTIPLSTGTSSTFSTFKTRGMALQLNARDRPSVRILKRPSKHPLKGRNHAED